MNLYKCEGRPMTSISDSLPNSPASVLFGIHQLIRLLDILGPFSPQNFDARQVCVDRVDS